MVPRADDEGLCRAHRCCSWAGAGALAAAETGVATFVMRSGDSPQSRSFAFAILFRWVESLRTAGRQGPSWVRMHSGLMRFAGRRRQAGALNVENSASTPQNRQQFSALAGNRKQT